MKIGLLGGTFDPPHFGHLLLASEVLEQCQLEQVWFIPNRVPPHKEGGAFSGKEHRINMVKLAIAGNPRFHVSMVEIERVGPSYTYDTMKQLKSEYNDALFSFIIGADMVNDLPNWHQIDQLVEITTFIGVNRQGYVRNSPYEKWIKYVDMPPIAISSSFLRERFRLKQNTRYYLPDNVRNYIEENQLYG